MGETVGQFVKLVRENQTFAIIVASTLIIAMLFSLAIIFYKIRKKPWKALIPIYNQIYLMDVLDIPVWMFLTMVIPFVNIIGLPFMLILVGWKLGNYCRKGIVMKLGLILFPPLFFPLLAASFIDIDGTGRYVMEPVKLPDDFSLDAVEVNDIDNNLMAMSLGNSEIIEQIAPIMATRKVEAPAIPTVKRKSFDEVEAMTSANEVEDLKKILPTADDLTFDYNTLYKDKPKPEEEKKEEKIEETTEEIKPDFELASFDGSESTIDYNELYKDIEINSEEKEETSDSTVEEIVPDEEEPKIIIHEVALEAAEPIDVAGPIPINKRYDFQSQKTETKEVEVATIHDIEYKEEVEETPTVEEEKIEAIKEAENLEEVKEEIPNPVEVPTIDLSEDEIEEINPMAPPVISSLIPNENLNIENASLQPTIDVTPVVNNPASIEAPIVSGIEPKPLDNTQSIPVVVDTSVSEGIQQPLETPVPIAPVVMEPVQTIEQSGITEVSQQSVVNEINSVVTTPAVPILPVENTMVQSSVVEPIASTPIPEVVPNVIEQNNLIQQPVPEVTPMVSEPIPVAMPEVPAQPVVQDVVPQPIPEMGNTPVPEIVEQPIAPVQDAQAVPPVQTVFVQEVNSSNNGDLPMQAASPFGADGMPSLADVPDLNLPNVNEVQQVDVPEIDLTEQAMQGMRERTVIEPGTRVDQIVSMNIAEPDQLPVGVLVKPPEPVAMPEIPQPVQQPQPEMTRAEAMGIKQNFFSGVVPNEPINVSANPPMMNQGPMNTTMMLPSNNVSMNPMMNNMVPPQQNMMPQPMMNGMPPGNMNPDPVSIFQVNSPTGGPLLRPLENAAGPVEKTCPVCGVKLKADCPICIMCGFKF